MSHLRNLSGTVSASFSIGRQGITIYQGEDEPSSALGRDGDYYVVRGSSVRFLGRVQGQWTDMAAQEETFVAEQVYRGEDFEIDPLTDYLAVLRSPYTIDNTNMTIDSTVVTIDAHPGEFTSVILPSATEGQTIVVKDETSRSEMFEIRVSADDLIDAQVYQVISDPHGYLELIYSGGKWNVVGR